MESAVNFSPFVLPAKHSRHIGIMTLSVSASLASSVASHFWFLIDNF